VCSPEAIRQHQHQRQPPQSGATSRVRSATTANGSDQFWAGVFGDTKRRWLNEPNLVIAVGAWAGLRGVDPGATSSAPGFTRPGTSLIACPSGCTPRRMGCCRRSSRHRPAGIPAQRSRSSARSMRQVPEGAGRARPRLHAANVLSTDGTYERRSRWSQRWPGCRWGRGSRMALAHRPAYSRWPTSCWRPPGTPAVVQRPPPRH